MNSLISIKFIVSFSPLITAFSKIFKVNNDSFTLHCSYYIRKETVLSSYTADADKLAGSSKCIFKIIVCPYVNSHHNKGKIWFYRLYIKFTMSIYRLVLIQSLMAFHQGSIQIWNYVDRCSHIHSFSWVSSIRIS